ncbi:MAG: dipeptide ABC transporter ATP-binding protein [Spirochaetaceae bacterium]|nr:dipeptide ABC transporter ATP-binding protein [Spirochaetaceae bacterium]
MKKNKRILLDVKHLKKHFPIKKGLFKADHRVLKAVDDISIKLYESETLGLVGESGCGKTTAGRTILRLYHPTSGEILMNTAKFGDPDTWEDLADLSYRQLKRFRNNMQVIYQDPYGSLNPRMDIRSIIIEPLKIHRRSEKSEWNDRAEKILKAVGLEPEYMKRFPHEFSGGQRQRIAIARALILEPRIIIADEPVSALDVSIQAQVLNLLKELQDQFNLTYLFIAHDLGVVKHISDRIAVMYLGKIVEITDSITILESPLHPYTEALLSAVPVADPDRIKNQIPLSGDVPSPIDPPPGCHFHPRCPYAVDLCRKEVPTLTERTPGHSVSCIRADELSLKGVHS